MTEGEVEVEAEVTEEIEEDGGDAVKMEAIDTATAIPVIELNPSRADINALRCPNPSRIRLEQSSTANNRINKPQQQHSPFHQYLRHRNIHIHH